ncbi:MAG: insulinase family protein [Pseudomonadota bacterium]
MKFTEIRQCVIPSMQATLYEYEHGASGARHVHLAYDDAEMAFLVAFPTVPDKSDGRAHILEHLALCGSAKYPVRDPFFSMLRRSTATFMNAMTSPDRTVYPFASTDKTDYFNLLGVYLDAAFFPNLDYLDYLQEGWRHTLENGKLGYGGVVFNEMKGAFADPMRELGQSVNAVLFSGTTYEVEYGGDPLEIPHLTHEDLKAFHASHYHPSQALFMTSGGIDPGAVQAVICQQVLSRFTAQDAKVPRRVPALASAWAAPKRTRIGIPSVAGNDDEHGIQIAWRMGEAADPLAYCEAYLLEAGLVGDSSAPLTQAMETAGYGRPSAFNGLDPHLRQMVFHLGMEGLTAAQCQRARDRLWKVLETTAEQGVPISVLQAAMRDLRFSQRQISSGRTPYGLRKLLEAVPLAMAGADPLIALDNETSFADMDRRIRDPQFFKQLVRSLLDSPNRLDAEIVPDTQYFVARQRIENDRLADLEATITAQERSRIEADNTALLARQRQPPDNGSLPRIRPQDVSSMPRPAFELPPLSQRTVGFRIASNGVSYANVIYDVSHFPESEWQWLDLYANLLPDLGVGDRTFEQAAAWRQRLVPRFDVELDAFEQVVPPADSKQVDCNEAVGRLKLQIVFAARNLREQATSIASVLSESIRQTRFDETDRIAFLIDSVAETLLQELGESGDRYAAIEADAPFSARARFDRSIEGTGILRFYRDLALQIESEQGMAEIVARLQSLHQAVIDSEVTVLCAGVEDDGHALAALIDVPGRRSEDASMVSVFIDDLQRTVSPGVPDMPALTNTALVAPAQVNHCFATWRVPYLGHADCPALSVLANLLTNQILHQALREEGGAYGGRAKNAPQSGLFTMFSYRDPRLADTYRDFDRAIEWVVNSALSREAIEEAIIGVIGDLDKPQSPYDEALYAWRMRERGVTPEIRRQFRTGVLTCTDLDLKSVAERYLQKIQPSRAAFAGESVSNFAGLEPIQLLELAEVSAQLAHA